MYMCFMVLAIIEKQEVIRQIMYVWLHFSTYCCYFYVQGFDSVSSVVDSYALSLHVFIHVGKRNSLEAERRGESGNPCVCG